MSELILELDLVGSGQERVLADVSVRRDTVEFRCGSRLVGIADRDRLREWLHNPDGVFTYDEMAWLWSGWDVGVSIRGVVPGYFFPGHVVNGLRQFI